MYTLFCSVSHLVRVMFNPAMIGTILVVVYVFAWMRMEELAESKRNTANQTVLAKKSFTLSCDNLSLSEYCDSHNGVWFGHNGFSEVMAHMQRKVPLNMHALCQPLELLPKGVLWRSTFLTVWDLPTKPSEEISTMSPAEALGMVESGFGCVWGDARFLAKDFVCFGKFNFHDSVNFFNIYLTPHMFKRAGSISFSEFQSADFADSAIHFKTDSIFPKIKIQSKQVFAAISILACSIGSSIN